MSVIGQPIPITNFQGTFTTAARNLPDGVSNLSLTIDATQMTNPALQVGLLVDFSPDGGATWASTNPSAATLAFPFVDTYLGGALDRHLNPVTSIVTQIPFPSGTNRQTKATITNTSGVPWNATVTINAT